ncbi:MAG: cobalt-precorrin-5B (C(1))-methyltransferase CbiD [Geobacteraceae bacterium]|nr:cobalt-precorrin-5B (C(1))-methyltransferase CbiD [Geobacteraceae bacterium]
MGKKNLKFGYTTGACAAAAAKGAALMIREQRIVDEVEIVLPRGECARFRLHGQAFTRDSSSCFVVKDAGDDPDVTNGAEIHVTVMLPPPAPPFHKGENDVQVIIEGGVGIGRVTKPGLAIPVGEWAINPIPRKMITAAILEAYANCRVPGSNLAPPSVLHVEISIPNGAELAEKTLNARLGVIGGLSILGTSGIVKPVSAAAWTDTIDTAIDVALACGCETVVLSTGRTSEIAAQRFFAKEQNPGQDKAGRDNYEASSLAARALRHEPAEGLPLPEEAYIMMGDHVGHALRACCRKGVKHVILVAQFAKLLKIACGHEQTHVSSSGLDLPTLAEWLKASPRTSRFVQSAVRANSARELLEASGNDHRLVKLVCSKASDFAAGLVHGPKVKVFLAGYGGEVLYFG